MIASSTMRSSVFIVFSVLFFGMVSSSAIPMWEYLTQDEKIMYLYNMFQTQVSEFCETTSCKQELRNYGWSKLKNMSEDHLDKMDPFQRGSNDIIWESVMEGHEMMKTTSKPKSSSTLRPNSFEDDTKVSDASAKIGNTYKVLPPKDFTFNRPQYTVGVSKPEYKLSEQSSYYTDDSTYTSSNKIQESTTEGFPIIETYGEYQRIPLTGPMVIKVHVDGSPVTDQKQSLPEDDDLKQYQMTKTALQIL